MFPDLTQKRALVLGNSPLREAAVAALREAGASVLTADNIRGTDPHQVDILVTLPKKIVAQPLEQVSDDTLDEAIDGVFRTTFHATRAVLPKMRERGWGRIIHVVWGQAVGAMRNVSVDAAANAAVNQFGHAVGIEYARSGVTVNTIALGWFPEIGVSDLTPLERYIPARRFGNGEDLGALIVFLASTRASYITSQTHLLDGGLRARG